jgi:hypothetical protein
MKHRQREYTAHELMEHFFLTEEEALLIEEEYARLQHVGLSLPYELVIARQIPRFAHTRRYALYGNMLDSEELQQSLYGLFFERVWQATHYCHEHGLDVTRVHGDYRDLIGQWHVFGRYVRETNGKVYWRMGHFDDVGFWVEDVSDPPG